MLKVDKTIKNIRDNINIKLTQKREIILQIFIENREKHLSAEDVYLLVKKKNYSIGMATIYRTLDLFADREIIIKRDFGDNSARYEFIYKDKERKHHHLICKNCGKVIEMSGLLPDNLEEKLLKEENFQVEDHCLKIYGYCNECRNNVD